MSSYRNDSDNSSLNQDPPIEEFLKMSLEDVLRGSRKEVEFLKKVVDNEGNETKNVKKFVNKLC